MLRLLNYAKGVILLFIVLVCLSNIITARVRQINRLEQANSLAYYEN